MLRSGDAQQAWAFDLGADFTAKDVPLTPKLGAEWIFWSGKNVGGGAAGWDPLARGYYTTALREFQTGSATTGFYPNGQTYYVNGVYKSGTAAATNQHQLALYGSVKPMEDVTIAPRLSWFVLDKAAIPMAGASQVGGIKRRYAGMEWDTQVTYNYTDDVQFGVIYGLFAPGSIYRTPNDNVSQELISSMSVKF